ncbi:hypothetical protein CRYUN_Cryun14cG0072100 [Craigia yunnanensis]
MGTREIWRPPITDYIKVNVDAAYSRTTGLATLGVVARNEDEEIRFSTVTKIEDMGSSMQVEIKVILFGLQKAKEMNVKKIQLKSDCLMTVKGVDT